MKKVCKLLSLVVTLSLIVSAICVCNFSAAALTESVIYDADVSFSGTTAGWGGLLVPIDDLTQAIRDEVAANGPISGDEYYKFDVTGTSSGYICPGFYQDGPPYLEAWGVEESGVYVVRPTATKKDGTVIDAGNLVCNLTQFCVFNDGNADVTLTHIKISVFRGAGGSNPTQPSVTQPSVTQPSVTQPSVTQPSVTPGGVQGDANGDGSLDMKDVLVIRKFIAGMSVTLDQNAADYNGDKSVDMKDVLAVRKALAAG